MFDKVKLGQLLMAWPLKTISTCPPSICFPLPGQQQVQAGGHQWGQLPGGPHHQHGGRRPVPLLRVRLQQERDRPPAEDKR